MELNTGTAPLHQAACAFQVGYIHGVCFDFEIAIEIVGARLNWLVSG